MVVMERITLFGMEASELEKCLGASSRIAQELYRALYRHRVTSLEHLTGLSQELRQELRCKGFTIEHPEIVQTATSTDGTERYLVRMSDGQTVETVWMPDRAVHSPAAKAEDRTSRIDQRNRGSLANSGYRRATICVSSQVGCAVNCQFCLTAKLGWTRNLTAAEIAGQVMAVLNRQGIKIGRDRINLVFMGMGEPFLNYDAVMTAIRLLVQGVGIPESRMTVSTSGIEPAIRRFATETIRPNLALSLNASNDDVRERVMPITRKWRIAELLEAVKTIPMRKRDWVTFEYVLLRGVNDQLEHAAELLELLAGMRAKVNLLVWNPGPGIGYSQPDPEQVAVFQTALIEGGIRTHLRRPRGRDIYAACGQLKRTVREPELVAIGE